MMRSRRWSLVVLALPALLTGCGDDPSGTDQIPPSSASVDVGNIFFQSARNGSRNPAVDTVAAGGTVSWTWSEAGVHTVRFDDPDVPGSTEMVESGSVFSATFPAAGTFSYDCSVHGTAMAGTLVVR
jgi:plastocyanin